MATSSSRCTASDDPLFFAIVDFATERPLGVASYLRIDPANGVIEVGHLCFSPALQRTPLATEAMDLMMRRVLRRARLPPLRVDVQRTERALDRRRAAARLSARGVFRQAKVEKGRSRDTAWFAILDREWPALRAAFEAWLDPGNFDAAGRQRQRLEELRAAHGAGAARER
jgi:RimJ/RimL family protein N-acetyltransferase